MFVRLSCKMKMLVPISLFLLAPTFAHCQAPDGFRWVNFKQDSATLSKVEQALKPEAYSAIREIGILGDFALVMTAKRGPDQPSPLGDEWNVYNVSTKTWNITSLIVGYNLEIKDWISFQPDTIPDLGVVYLDCWECEPASLFTALRFEQQNGWRARWLSKETSKQPGIVLGVTNVGDPYTDEDVDQVFAVIAPRSRAASVGTWYHSRDLASGKITNVISKFFVDPVSGKDRSTVLTGRDGLEWERRLCKVGPDFLSGLFGGQENRACKKVVERQPR